MVVAFLRGILKKHCEGARDYLVENLILDAISAELQATDRTLSSLVTATTLSACDPKSRHAIMENVEKSLLRASQLRRTDMFDSLGQIGLRGFGKGQKLSLVKLFRLTKKGGIIQAIHDSCQ